MTLEATPDARQLALAPLDDKVDHVRGSPAGRLIIEYGDYECPYSRQALFICIGGTPPTGGAAGIGLATNAGAVRRPHLAVLTVDRGDDAGHRLACQQAAGHPQRV